MNQHGKHENEKEFNLAVLGLDAALKKVAQYFIAVNALPTTLVTRFRRICNILHILFSPERVLEFLSLADGGPNVLAHGASHEITRHKACLHRHVGQR